MSLQGASQLRARLKAIRTVFKPVGRDWADETVRLARATVPVRTGHTRASIRRKNASQKKASVQAVYTAVFVQQGTKAHTIKPKKARTLRFTIGRQAVFSKKVNHPRTTANPFGKRAGAKALHKADLLKDLIELWNRAT